MTNAYERALREIQGPSQEERERRRKLIEQDEADLAKQENENV